MEYKKYPATASIRKDGIYIEINRDEELTFSFNIPLNWANGDLAGALDISESGELLGIELIGLEEEITNPSPLT